MNKIFLLFLISIFFLRCSKDKNVELPVYELSLLKEIDIISDTILFYNIKCLEFHNSKLYFTNPVYDHIVCLDKGLNFERYFGQKGKGANELLGIDKFAIEDTLICVINNMNLRINVFSLKGELISEESRDNSVLFQSYYKFSFNGNEIIGCSDFALSPLIKYNIYTKDHILFGKTYQFSSDLQTSIRNNRLTAKYNDGYIIVSNNLPYIEIYSKDKLEQTERYDYSIISQVKNKLRLDKSISDNSENMFNLLCEDICFTKENLYILVYSYTDNNKINLNQIIKFEIFPNIKPITIYKLPGKWCQSFCVSEDDGIIYAYEYTDNKIGMYLINENEK
jgi:hypothetical protein